MFNTCGCKSVFQQLNCITALHWDPTHPVHLRLLCSPFPLPEWFLNSPGAEINVFTCNLDTTAGSKCKEELIVLRCVKKNCFQTNNRLTMPHFALNITDWSLTFLAGNSNITAYNCCRTDYEDWFLNDGVSHIKQPFDSPIDHEKICSKPFS